MSILSELVKSKLTIPDYHDKYLKEVRDKFKQSKGLKTPDGDMRNKKLVLCPFHDDTDPSLSYIEGKGVFNCFANCGAKGDLIQYHRFTLKIYHSRMLNYDESCEDLARLLGISAADVRERPQTLYEKGVWSQLKRHERYDKVRQKYSISNFREELGGLRKDFSSGYFDTGTLISLSADAILKMSLVEKEICD